MEDFPVIEDNKISEDFALSLEEVREYMEQLAKRQKKKQWLIISLNNRYIFYHQTVIEKFKKLYNQGLSEKQILYKLNEEVKIKSRAQIKAIEDALIEQKKLEKREFSDIKLLSFDSEIL
jgi:hypothetical protein